MPGLMFASNMPIINAIGSSLVAVSAFGVTTAGNYALSGFVDWTLAATILGGGVIGGAMGGAAAEFTPKLAIQPVTGIYALGFTAYCAYLFIPSALHLKEAVQWHISRSRI